jgi:hypothetical protein
VAAAVVARRRAAFAGNISSWVSQWRQPSPCPYAMSWLLELPGPAPSVERLLRILRPIPGQRLLELGPGIGVHALPVVRVIAPNGRVEAFDIQQDMLDAVAQRACCGSVIHGVEPHGATIGMSKLSSW